LRHGEIWWYEPPGEKPRPVAILTRNEAIGRLLDVIAMPATGAIRRWPNEVEIGVEDGMPIECVLVAENTLSAEKAFLVERITSLSPQKMTEVCAALVSATSCH
jgi:mRNA-degrading endonuclease toxin of MazEF toxin-antitoxin module